MRKPTKKSILKARAEQKAQDHLDSEVQKARSESWRQGFDAGKDDKAHEIELKKKTAVEVAEGAKIPEGVENWYTQKTLTVKELKHILGAYDDYHLVGYITAQGIVGARHARKVIGGTSSSHPFMSNTTIVLQ